MAPNLVQHFADGDPRAGLGPATVYANAALEPPVAVVAERAQPLRSLSESIAAAAGLRPLVRDAAVTRIRQYARWQRSVAAPQDPA